MAEGTGAHPWDDGVMQQRVSKRSLSVTVPAIVLTLLASGLLGACGSDDDPSASATGAAATTEASPTGKATKGSKKKKKKKATATSGGKAGTTTKATSKTKKKSGGAASAPALTDTVYVATNLEGTSLVSGSSIELTFGNGQISVKTGCATLIGPATWESGTLDVGGGGLARSGGDSCSESLKQQETWVQSLLEAKPSMGISGKKMEITDGFSGMTLTQK